MTRKDVLAAAEKCVCGDRELAWWDGVLGTWSFKDGGLVPAAGGCR